MGYDALPITRGSNGTYQVGKVEAEAKEAKLTVFIKLKIRA